MTNSVVTELHLRSEANYGHKVPPGALGEVLRLLPVAISRSIRMAFEGRSAARGPRPAWLQAMSDIRLVDFQGQEDTILYFESPHLADAAPDLYQQTKFEWSSRPDGADCGFDLLGDVLTDVAAENEDSERFDVGFLNRLARFRRGLRGTFQSIQFTGHRYSSDHPAILDERVVQTAQQLGSHTPASERTRVVGTLDMVRASTQSFAVKLDTGEEIRGVLIEGNIGALTNFLERRVLILGKAVYRPSGRLLRVDADEVAPTSEEDTFFSKMPTPTQRTLDVRRLAREQPGRRGLSVIIGKWPGDETDDEIAQALQELS